MTSDTLSDSGISSLLQRIPALHKTAVQRCIEWAGKYPEFALVIHGSAVKGGFDRYSDIDFTLVYDPQLNSGVTNILLEDLINSIGQPIVRFRADHIGYDDTHIIYFDCGHWVIKLDIRIAANSPQLSLPSEFLVLSDPFQLLSQVLETPAQPLDRSLLFEKICGWLWFSYSRLARGEYFAAARAIDFTRENALLPIVLLRLGLAQDGHRRLESRLPPELLQVMRNSYPAGLQRDQLYTALHQLYQLTRSELAHCTLAHKTQLDTALERMWHLIAAAEQAHSGNRRSKA